MPGRFIDTPEGRVNARLGRVLQACADAGAAVTYLSTKPEPDSTPDLLPAYREYDRLALALDDLDELEEPVPLASGRRPASWTLDRARDTRP